HLDVCGSGRLSGIATIHHPRVVGRESLPSTARYSLLCRPAKLAQIEELVTLSNVADLMKSHNPSEKPVRFGVVADAVVAEDGVEGPAEPLLHEEERKSQSGVGDYRKRVDDNPGKWFELRRYGSGSQVIRVPLGVEPSVLCRSTGCSQPVARTG